MDAKKDVTLKTQENKLIVLDSIEMKEIKTKEFAKVLDAFKLDRNVLFVVDIEEEFDNAYMSMSNIPYCAMTTVEGLNVYDIQDACTLVMTKAAAEKAGEVLKDE